MKSYVAGIGSSSKSPTEIIDIAIRFGKMLVDLGHGISSGDALRMDRAFFAGAKQSARFYNVPSRVYLAWNGVGLFGKAYHSPSEYYFDAQRFPTLPQAEALALEARGSWEKCGKGCKALHSRNPFQILGADLLTPVRFVIFYAIPTSKGVSGGTNTAYKVALKSNIPTFNLYYDDVKEAVLRLLEKHEANYGRADTEEPKAWIDPRQWGDVPQEKRITEPVAGSSSEPQRSGNVSVYEALEGLIYPKEGQEGR